MSDGKGLYGSDRATRQHTPPPRPVLGLEAEFTLYINDVKRRPEKVFGTPQRLVREKMLPRTGRSFQLPAGGAIYFDTGVIEVATPIVEFERGCCYRATRLLWEQIGYLRQELDAWSRRHNCNGRLEGFSAHYNFSFPQEQQSSRRTATQLGDLLAHILPMPVILLAANRQSTAVGVRPRGNRVEITADFTPDPDLMLATCGCIAGVVAGVLEWNSFALTEIEAHGIPRLAHYRLRKHSSRRGRRILANSLAHDPFTSDPSAAIWKTRDGRELTLRQFSGETMRPFRREIAWFSDRGTLEHIEAVFAGNARSLLDFEQRPGAYEDAGREIAWARRRTRRWSRSAYEKVIHRVISHEPLLIGGKRYRAERMQGWYEVVCRETKTKRRRVFTLDDLVAAATRAPKRPR